ncbi:MAG TPA: RcnB family protein [Xanthomonadaceae bacterium]|nr:RcnB family protein [Xanthomonadaceae bacterium]
MKSLLIAVLATLALSGPSLADERGKEARKAQEEAQREHQKDRREAEKAYWKDRREADKEYRKDLKEERKAYRRWARGEHIPRDYLVETYYIRDYRDYDLAPPPPGYMWVRPYEDDDTYYMVQLATGLISQIFGN